MIEIILQTKPIPWAAARVTSRGAINPRAKDKKLNQWLIRSQYLGDIINDYVVIEMVFEMPIPNSASKKEREQMLAGEIIPTNCDTTNCQKFFEDCLKKIVIEDDRNVAKISSQKLYANKGQVTIKIWTLKEKNAFDCRGN